MGRITKSIFFKPRNKKLARKISIRTPSEFRASIAKIRKAGVTLEEKRALALARTRAKVQLMRKNLSPKERRQFKAISIMKLPKVNRKK